VRQRLPAVRCCSDQDEDSGQPTGRGARTNGATGPDAPPLQAVGLPVNCLRAHTLTAPPFCHFIHPGRSCGAATGHRRRQAQAPSEITNELLKL